MRFEIKDEKLLINGVIQEIPNISFIEEIGSGSNAKVFLAVNKLLERQEAIKVWVPRRGENNVDTTRFSKEIQKNAKATFPNIAKFYDANIEGAFHYARLEYIAGQTLKKFLEQPQELWARYIILKTVLESMKSVYDAGLYHGDLHTKNIIINNNMPYIIDFGTSIFSGVVSSHKRDCTMLIDLCYEVVPELYKFEFVEKNEMIKEGSSIATKLLLSTLFMCWSLENETSDMKDEYSNKSWWFQLDTIAEEFPFIDTTKIGQFYTKHITPHIPKITIIKQY